MKLRDITNIIKYGTKVEIIQQDHYNFPDSKNDFSLIVNPDFQYGNHRAFEDYADYDVRMITSKDNYLTIYICKGGE